MLDVRATATNGSTLSIKGGIQLPESGLVELQGSSATIGGVACTFECRISVDGSSLTAGGIGGFGFGIFTSIQNGSAVTVGSIGVGGEVGQFNLDGTSSLRTVKAASPNLSDTEIADNITSFIISEQHGLDDLQSDEPEQDGPE